MGMRLSFAHDILRISIVSLVWFILQYYSMISRTTPTTIATHCDFRQLTFTSLFNFLSEG